ncbi:WD40 repeat domain-containing protein [Streptomyces misionensis]|uniref:WD40 repeat domain-containing protein n=1 Tax=Streptomyces misionensis TaxID=67331 RepID=UPI0033D13CA9
MGSPGAVTSVLVVFALLASVLGVIAERRSVWEGQQAARKAAVVRSTDLAADAEAVRSTDPGLAAQLAVAAYRSAPTRKATDQLYSSLGAPVDGVLASGSPVLRIATQPDGPLAADSDANASVRVWNLADPAAPVLESTIPAGGSAIAIAPGGRLLAGHCAATGKALCLWDLTDPRHPRAGAELPVPARLSGRKIQLSAMVVSPDGSLLAAAAEQSFTLLWSVADPAHPRVRAVLPDPASEALLAGVAFAPRGHLLAQTSQRGATQVWDVADPARPKKLASLSAGFQSVAFSPDGRMMGAAGDAVLRLWRMDGPDHPKSVEVSTGTTPADLESVAFSPDGSRLVYGGVGTDTPKSALCQVRLTPANLQGMALTDCAQTGFDTFTVAYTAGGDILTGGRDGKLRLWRRPLAQAAGMAITGRDVWSMSPDGKLIAAPRDTGSRTSPSPLGIWDASAAGDPVLDATFRLPDLPQMVTFLAPKALLTVAHNGAVQLWDLHDTHETASLGSVDFPTEPSGLGPVILTPGVTTDQAGGLVAVQGHDRLVLWRVTGALHAERAGSIPLPEPASDIAGLVNSHTACVLTGSGIIWWDVDDPDHPVRGATSALPRADKGGLTAAATGVVAATSGVTDPGASLSLFVLAGGRPRSTVALPGAVSSTVGLSDDGRLLVAAGAGDNTATVWDARDPAHPRVLGTISTLRATSNFVFAPNGRLLADGSSEQPGVQLWRTQPPSSPTLLATLEPKDVTGEQLTAAFSPSGSTIAVAASDSVTLYDTDPAEVADTLCSATLRTPITPSEWNKYAPGVPYRNPCSGGG